MLHVDNVTPKKIWVVIWLLYIDNVLTLWIIVIVIIISAVCKFFLRSQVPAGIPATDPGHTGTRFPRVWTGHRSGYFTPRYLWHGSRYTGIRAREDPYLKARILLMAAQFQHQQKWRLLRWAKNGPGSLPRPAKAPVAPEFWVTSDSLRRYKILRRARRVPEAIGGDRSISNILWHPISFRCHVSILYRIILLHQWEYITNWIMVRDDA